jgi:hypothetical protein
MNVEIALDFFYSQEDEKRFFQGLSDIPAVKDYEGGGVNLIIRLDMRKLGSDDLRELIALLYRYRIPLAPLHLLAERPRFSWLNNSKGYWHKSLLDVATRQRSRNYGDLPKNRRR